MINSEIEDGVSADPTSSGRNCVVNIKNVTNKKPRSTIGVISMDGLLFGILIFGIFLLGIYYLVFAANV
jgi:hypothetical protein